MALINLCNFFSPLIGLCLTSFFRTREHLFQLTQFREKRKICIRKSSREPYIKYSVGGMGSVLTWALLLLLLLLVLVLLLLKYYLEEKFLKVYS